jgi:hypothetical protein
MEQSVGNLEKTEARSDLCLKEGGVNWESRASPPAIGPRHCLLSEGPIASTRRP